MSSAQSTADILDELMGATTTAVASLETKAKTTDRFVDQFNQLEQKFEELEKIQDEQRRQTEMRVLEASLDQLKKEATQEERDLAEAVFGLNAMLEQMGLEYTNLSQPNAQEKSIIQHAENEVTRAEAEKLEAAGKMALFGIRERAVAAADQRITQAKAKLEEEKRRVAQMGRQRLMSANMEQSLQEFTLRVEKTIDIMDQRLNDVEEQLAAVTGRKAQAFEVKQAAARKLEAMDAELNQAEEDLRRREEMLGTLENGTEEYVAAERGISELRAKVEDLRGQRNVAFVVHQSKEKFAAELEIHERTQMKLRDNQRGWIASLRSDTQERVVTFRSRLEAMKAAADQQVAKNLDDMGARIDANNAEYMAAVGAASDRIRMEKLEKHPERLRRITEIASAQMQAVQKIRVREQDLIAKFREKYGIDPMESSFFHYEDPNAGGE